MESFLLRNEKENYQREMWRKKGIYTRETNVADTVIIWFGDSLIQSNCKMLVSSVLKSYKELIILIIGIEAGHFLWVSYWGMNLILIVSKFLGLKTRGCCF